MKPTKSFRIDPELIEQAKVQGINLTKLIERALSKELKLKECPTCGHRRQSKK